MAALADLVAMKTALARAQAGFLKDVKEWQDIVKKEQAVRKTLDAALKAAEKKVPKVAAEVAKAEAAVEKHRKVVAPLYKEADKWSTSHMYSENAIRQIGSRLIAMIAALENKHADLKKLAQTLATEAIAARNVESGEVPEGRGRSGGQSEEGGRARR